MIDLTALPLAGGTSMRLLDWGGELEPPLGGVTQRLDRLGSRHAIDCVVPPLAIEPDGRMWISRLKRAKREGGRIAVPQVDFVMGSPGAPYVNGSAQYGTTLALRGFTPGYTTREGQFFSILHGGRYYLHSADAQASASGDGGVILTITPMLRVVPASNAPVAFAQPVLEGWLSGDEIGWTLEAAHTVGLRFTITERA